MRRLIAQQQGVTKIRKLVYQVQSLHIKEMSGTMNIGIIAPLDEEAVENMPFEMPGSPR